MGIQDHMNDMNKHNLDTLAVCKHCSFCKHAYLKFFNTWCDVKNSCKDLKAIECPNYSPTLDPIEHRSLS